MPNRTLESYMGDIPAASTVDSDDGFLMLEDGAIKMATASQISAAGASLALNDLTDVTITAAASGEIIRYNGSAWVDAANTAANVSYNGNAGMSATDVEAAIDELDDEKLSKVAGGASVEDIGAIESNVNTVASTGATETLDTSVYGVHDCTMDQACTFTFSNPAPSGKCTIFTLILRGAFTPTFPAAVDWGDASAPTYTTPSVYVFTTVDAGTIWLGAQVGKAFG